MISKLLNTLGEGTAVMRNNGRLLFVACLLFLFPLAFLLLAEHFFSVAYSNVQTAQRQQVGTLHDLISTVVTTGALDQAEFVTFSEKQLSDNADLKEIRLVERTEGALRVVWSANQSKVGTTEEFNDIYDSAPANGQTFIFEVFRDGSRVWQAVRTVRGPAGQSYYLFSEHSLAAIDEKMADRKNDAYFGLAMIFIFLIGLSYWVYRQTEWASLYRAQTAKLEERDLFTNMIAHEFRTPLTAIKGYASLLGDSDTLKVNERQHLEKISLSTDRLLALVNDFLEVARIQSGKMELSSEALDLAQICNEVVVALTPIAAEKNLTIQLADTAAPITLKSDPKRLYQVLQNIVSNAVKYTKSGGVELAIEETPLAVTVRIKDTGMGISADDQDKLFAPFARVGGVESTGITGTGLGMWITKQYVELLGGSIAVESIKNVGTHIVLSFSKRHR